MLRTDLYQITMAAGYFALGKQNTEVVFQMTYRKNPFGGDSVTVYGVTDAIRWIEEATLYMAETDYLSTLKGSNGEPIFSHEFIEWLGAQPPLSDLVTVTGLSDGDVAQPHEPILVIRGPLWAVQWVETHILHCVNAGSLLATKARRIVEAADGDPVLEFGYRRAQNPDLATRAAYVGGCAATSNVAAGMMYGIPVKGTHAHSWVMFHGTRESEQAAFNNYARAMPNNTTLLVDTFDTVEGVRKAINTFRMMRDEGLGTPNGIRLDSGDLLALSKIARQMLDEAGFTDVKIVASNDLDENVIRHLKRQRAPIDVWGVGTQMVVAADQPALGGVYKLSAVRTDDGTWAGRIKRSGDAIKASDPGPLVSYHCDLDDGLTIVVLSFEDEVVDENTIVVLRTGGSAGTLRELGLEQVRKATQPIIRRTVQEANAARRQAKLTEPYVYLTASVREAKLNLNE